jgi:4-amino-4-deoxy-L-arabinose transferase-like glycosyltransferase
VTQTAGREASGQQGVPNLKEPGRTGEALALALVFLVAAGIRLWRLDRIPPVVNGDETGSIIHPWEILLGHLRLFDLTHDLSVPALVFYLKALTISALGTQHSLLAVRFTTAAFSLLALALFYIILRRQVSALAAVTATLLFGTSYWYLNFSRLAWIAVDNVFFGLAFYLALTKTLEVRQARYAALTGVLAGLVAMNYMGGRIYLLAGALLYLPYLLRDSRKFLPLAAVMLITFAVVVSPLAATVRAHPDDYLRRAQTKSIFSLDEPYYGYQPQELGNILRHQVAYAARGFVLFDPAVSSEWVENPRLLPYKKPAVSLLVVVLFYLGFVGALPDGKGIFFLLVYVLNIVILQLPSTHIPSWSRAIGVLPAIYFFAGHGIDWLLVSTQRVARRLQPLVVGALLVAAVAASVYNVTVYWTWVRSERFAEAQSPAVPVTEMPAWQTGQLEQLRSGRGAFSIYEWQGMPHRQ